MPERLLNYYELRKAGRVAAGGRTAACSAGAPARRRVTRRRRCATCWCSCARAPAATSPTTSAPRSCDASAVDCRSTASTTCRPTWRFCARIPGEAGALLQDLLISVTNFFRDREAFDALEAQIPWLFKDKRATDTVRVWVPACATGEEAYSIAMLLSEHARKLDAPPQIQVFATDLDEDVIKTARDGSLSRTRSPPTYRKSGCGAGF